MLFVGVGFVLFRDQFHYLAPFPDLLEGSAGGVDAGVVDGSAEEDGEGLVKGLGTSSRPGATERLVKGAVNRRLAARTKSGPSMVGSSPTRYPTPLEKVQSPGATYIPAPMTWNLAPGIGFVGIWPMIAISFQPSLD